MTRLTINQSRETLLIEIERRCPLSACGARMRTGLTKSEARGYHGFRCERCEEWTEDVLAERDVPEWWNELKLVSLSDAHLRAQIISDKRDIAGDDDADARKDDSR